MKKNILNILSKIAGHKKENKKIKYKVFNGDGNEYITSDYYSYAENGYINNPIVNRCINFISKSVSSCSILLYKKNLDGSRTEIEKHKILDLINKPNPSSESNIFETIANYLMIDGNAYLQGIFNDGNELEELFFLRPDRIDIVNSKSFIPLSYRYNIDNLSFEFECNLENGFCEVLHFKNFNPLDDFHGISPIQTAKNSIEQYKEIIEWNKSILKQGGRPSGAITLKDNISEEQFERLKEDLNSNIKGSSNAGRVMILDGGMEWKEISVNPKDMDYIENKNNAARDIAIAFGIPAQLLGIPGDNTYSNMSEAKTIMWENTTIPLLNNITKKLSSWFSIIYKEDLQLEIDLDSISALSDQRQKLWDNLKTTDFITNEEKRAILGF